MPTMGSLFAGIGGFDLGFERAGFKTVWQVEKNAYCRRVLRRHFPHADRRVTDVRFAGARNLLPVDVICGGFPCQDISNAGLRTGIDGKRSGLWFHMHRIISELRPRYVVVENVAALLGRGMGRVLGDLSSIGYDAEWRIISAADMGAPHLRERVWVVAYPHGDRYRESRTQPESDTHKERNYTPCESRGWAVARKTFPGCEALSNADSGRCQSGREWPKERGVQILDCGGEAVKGGYHYHWSIEPGVGRLVNGVPARVDRLRALGNAVVPQIPELIARRLIEVVA